MQLKNYIKYIVLCSLIIIVSLLLNIITYNKTMNDSNLMIKKKIEENNKYFEKKLNDYTLKIAENNKEDDYILDLNNRLTKLENLSIIENEKNIQIIVLINKIYNLYYDNRNFKSSLDDLKILSQHNNIIYSEVLKLENFLDINSNISSFRKEYKKILKKNTNSKIKNFINENIQIRKNSDFKENEKDYKNISIIENYISKKDYENAIIFIKENNYENIFIETIKEINNNVEFNKIIDTLTKNIYSKYI